MSQILSKIDVDYIDSYKKKDQAKVSVLRMLKSAITNAQIDKKAALEDQDVLKIITKEIKQRKDAALQYSQGGRQDLADTEIAEAKLLEGYLPAQLSDSKLQEIVKKTIAESGLSSSKDFGKLMGLVLSQVAGKADGARVSSSIKQAL